MASSEYQPTELDHIFKCLCDIIEKHLDFDNFYLLFSTPSGLIKGQWYPYNSILNSEVEIWSDDFLKNQELLIDKCLYHTFAEIIHSEDNENHLPISPQVTYKDVLCLKDVTLYSNGKQPLRPSFLLFTSNITGFSLVDKNFKP